MLIRQIRSAAARLAVVAAVAAAATAAPRAANRESVAARAETPAAGIASAAACAAHGAALPEGFECVPLPDSLWHFMQGRSYGAGCPVGRADLRLLRLRHVTPEGAVRAGEMVVNRRIAAATLRVFAALYEARYPVASVRLIDRFDASDRRSMLANNTSAFCHRRVAGSRVLSRHSYGLAIDLNPLYNPYVKRRADGSLRVDPPEARPYADRRKRSPMTLTAESLPVKLFKKEGFSWGGDWRSLKDYQHFEMPARGR